MECRYCQASNAEDDHRCRRCGRRLRMTPVYTTSAAAPALHHELSERPQSNPPATRTASTITETAPPARSILYQRSLFSSRELPRVVSFESIAPTAPPPLREKTAAVHRTYRRRIIPGQQNLDFSIRSAAPADGAIYCDAPVAVPAQRAMAAALDGSLIVMAMALFGSVFYLAGGQLVLDSKTLPILALIAGALVLFYKALWCLAGGDSAGMRWSRLTLVDFDGHRPDRKQRFCRLAFGTLSLLAAGIGMLWALVDEETLTWHDHISKTFPTPY